MPPTGPPSLLHGHDHVLQSVVQLLLFIHRKGRTSRRSSCPNPLKVGHNLIVIRPCRHCLPTSKNQLPSSLAGLTGLARLARLPATTAHTSRRFQNSHQPPRAQIHLRPSKRGHVRHVLRYSPCVLQGPHCVLESGSQRYQFCFCEGTEEDGLSCVSYLPESLQNPLPLIGQHLSFDTKKSAGSSQMMFGLAVCRFDRQSSR